MGTRTAKRRYMESEDRRRRIVARLLALITIASGLLYLRWVWSALDWSQPVFAGLFLGAEGACLVLFALSSLGVWRLRYKPPEGLAADREVEVDVLVTTCGEPISVIRATLEAVSRIRHRGNLNVHVLDDGGSAEVRELADSLGFRYLSRAGAGLEQTDGKAGNLNFGLSGTRGEFVMTIDADQVPFPGILEAMLGYLRFPRVAFVQSKQTFVVPKNDPFFSHDSIFYDVIQFANDNYNTAISCGSGVIYRRVALEDVGGFATWNLVEDLTTSYELHSRGWKSFYYPHAASVGLAPTDVLAVYQQRGQWALDTMRLFIWDNPLLKRGLNRQQRQQYLIIASAYLCSAFVFPFFFVVPIWTYLTGDSVFSLMELDFLLYRGLYFLSMSLAWRRLYRKQPVGGQFQILSGLFPVYLMATLRAFLYPPGRKPEYRANNLFGRSHGRLARVLAISPQLMVLLGNGLLPFYAVVYSIADTRVILINVCVSALAIWSLLPMVSASLFTGQSDSEQLLPQREIAAQTTKARSSRRAPDNSQARHHETH